MQVNWAVDATVSCGYQPSQPIHTHTHTHTYVRNNARGTLWQFEIGLAHPSADAVARCQMRLCLFRPASVICVTRKSLSIYCAVSFCFATGVAQQIKTKKETDNSIAVQEMEQEEKKDAPCSALLHMQMQHVKLSCCMNTLISALPHCLPSFQHLHVYFFESTLSFFLTLRQLWLMDWLADQTSEQPNWPVDHWTNWTDWQNADRLTPALAVSSCQSYPVPFYMSFRLPSAFVRSIWVKLSLMDFHARTLQITVTSQVTQWSEDLTCTAVMTSDARISDFTRAWPALRETVRGAAYYPTMRCPLESWARITENY